MSTINMTLDLMGVPRHHSFGPDTAAQSVKTANLQPVLRLRPSRAGITFEGRVASSMKLIPLTQGKCAIVDDQDYEFLNQYKWRVIKAKRKQTTWCYYAQRTTPRPEHKSVTMHREVLRRAGFPDAPQCDHKDTDGLNNQRHNLRPVSASQNRWGMRKRHGVSSKFKGVYWHKGTSKWMARIHFHGKTHYLGNFEKEIDAGEAYDSAARLHFGEFARLNIPTL